MGNIGNDLLKTCYINDIKIKKDMSLHLAIVNQPFLKYIMNGEKTIESRFSVNKCAPYKKINKDDVIFLKDSGKPITAYTIVKDVKFFENDELNLESIKNQYAHQICAENESFWLERKDKNYASLIWITRPKLINNVFIEKKDKRGWVNFQLKYPQTLILISGKIGSGKTYWAEKIAQHYICNKNSFSDFLKMWCIKSGLEINRENLQKSGELCIENNFTEFMEYTVLNNFNTINDILIVDGLRHVKVLEYYQKNIKKVIHININLNEDIRIHNIEIRDGVFNKSYDNSFVEKESSELRKQADIIINENSNEDDIFKKIDNLLKKEFQISFKI